MGSTSLRAGDLSAEAVQGAALALERVDHVEGGHGLSLGVLGVGDGITDDVLEEDLEDTAGLLVDQAGDALDTTTASQTADGRLGDPLDVVPKDLPVALGAAFAQTLSSFTTTGHIEMICEPTTQHQCDLFVPKRPNYQLSYSTAKRPNPQFFDCLETAISIPEIQIWF